MKSDWATLRIAASLTVLGFAWNSAAAATPVGDAPGALIENAASVSGGPAAEYPPLTVLSPADAALYGEIFALQEDAKWAAAETKIAQLADPVLMGYVRRQRLLHPTGHRSTYAELKEWLAFYADLPAADDIYSLALKRRGRGDTLPVRPQGRKWRTDAPPALHPDLESDYAATSRPRLAQIEGRVRYLIKQNEANDALREIEQHFARRTITEKQFDRMRSWIAASYYYQGYVGSAQRIAEDVAERNGAVAVLAYWTAGLIAFREGRMTDAFEHFNRMAAVAQQDGDLRAAAGFWAARSALAAGRGERVAPNLEIAAELPFTFYGQLALAQLGRDPQIDWTPPALSADDFERLAGAHPAARRAAALAQVGMREEADIELRWLNGAIDDSFDRELLAVACALDLPAAQIDISLGSSARGLAAGLYPVPQYQPANGFQADPALIYALMRQESKFKVEATSRVGARGLMQLMPRTASYIARDKSLQSKKGVERLYDPAYNLQLGQEYVQHLINTTAQGDLFQMAVAYNGGPGNLRRWKAEVPIEDPLLFIESIPNTESRDFVEKVLTNYWIYQLRLGKPARSRDEVAAGRLPLYDALDQAAGN